MRLYDAILDEDFDVNSLAGKQGPNVCPYVEEVGKCCYEKIPDPICEKCTSRVVLMLAITCGVRNFKIVWSEMGSAILLEHTQKSLEMIGAYSFTA
jgi:hypothetical protein